jgi:hypothetical protein
VKEFFRKEQQHDRSKTSTYVEEDLLWH